MGAQLNDYVVVLGMIGAWAEHQEAFLLDKIVASEGGSITISADEAGVFVEGLNRLQEGLVIVLNESNIAA